MNGENLVYDYRFNVVDSPSDWAFNWNYAECGTSRPTPRPHHATMWLTMNGDDPLQAVKKLFKQFSNSGRFPVNLKVRLGKESDGEEGTYILQVIHKATKATLFEGEMPKPESDGSMKDLNVGHFALFSSNTPEGTEMMKTMAENVSPGFVAYIPHERTVLMSTDDGYQVVAITGEGPDSKSDIDSNDYNDDDNDDYEYDEDGPNRRCRENLGTRFNLLHHDEQVARCYMSYRDGSYDASMGPTIEMIAVHQSHRGKGLAKVLFYWVLRFIERNFTLECLNNDAPTGHIMVKATQIGTQEVEIRRRKRDGVMVPVGFKEFVFDFCGFSVRVQKGVMSFMFNSRRPIDEEAVLYIPLLSKEQLAAKLVNDETKAPKPGNAFLRAKCGKRMCHWCREIGQDLQRCNRCEVAFYCNRECQKKDWKRHKKWCNETREEVRNKLIEEGGMIERPDGTYSLNMSFGMM